MDGLTAARWQMALTLGYHIIVACLGVGLPVLMLFAEWRFLRTKHAGWKVLARRWSKTFAVLFAVGAVSGTVLSFELGLLWPKFMGTFGPAIGLPFTLEAIAFFLEAIFAGIYLYTWDRLPARTHWLCGFPIAISGIASACFVVTANSWMNAPRGFVLENGKLTSVDPWTAMLNPATATQVLHMLVAAFLVTGFLVAAVYAFYRLRGKESPHYRRAMALGLAMGAIAAPLQAITGDFAAKMVARTQPVKFAAMEGQLRTEAGAPLRFPGFEIPGGLSWLAHGDSNAVVRGLDDVLPENRPPVGVVHVAFRLMVGAGVFLLFVAVASAVAAWRRNFPRWLLGLILASGPVAVIGLEAGWTVTEVGRQPWIVQGVMRTRDALTSAPGLGMFLAISVLVYAILSVGLWTVLGRIARTPLPEVPE